MGFMDAGERAPTHSGVPVDAAAVGELLAGGVNGQGAWNAR